MARSRKLEVVVAGDAKGLSRTFKKAGDDADHLEKRMHGIGGRIGGAFKLAGVAAGGALAVGLKKSVDAAIEAEKSQARLETQLKASGISYRNHASAIDEAIQKTSRLAGLDDEDLQDAFTNIVRVTGDVDKSLRLTGLAADFARAKHIDVAKAGEIVGKVAGGNTGILSRYGIQIEKGATATEALGKLQQKFKGQAEAYGKTTAGAQDRFRTAVENLQEKIGEKLLPVLTKAADKGAKFVDEMTRGTGAGGRFADKLKDIADRVRPIVKFFTDHPKIVAIAVGAWVTYRAAVALAIAVSRAKMLGMFGGLGPRAAAGGAVAGRAFGGAAAASSGTTFQRRAPGVLGGGKMRGAFRGAGIALGAVMGAAMLGELINQVEGRKGGTLRNILRGILPLSPQPGNPGLIAAKPGETFVKDGVPYVIGKDGLAVPLESPTGPQTPLPAPRRPSRRPRPASGPGQNAPGGARARASSVRATAASASPVARAAARRRYGAPELARLWVQAGGDPGQADLMAAIALAESGGDSGIVNSIGASGLWQIHPPEPGVLDPLTNARIAVRKLRTQGLGAWEAYTNGSYRQFLGQSGSDSGGSVVSSAAPVVRRAPLPLTATLIGGAGGGSKAPPKMGGRVPTGAFTGFTPAPRTTDPVGQARKQRIVFLAFRIRKIRDDFAAGRIKDPETFQRLATELPELESEFAELMGGGTTSLDDIPGATAHLGLLDEQAALAALTPDTADDQDVARRTLKARQDILAYAQSHGFSHEAIAQAARDVKTAQDAVDSGDTATTQLADAIRDFSEQLRRQNDFNERIEGITGGEAVRALADVISGELGPRVSLRGLTPGSGARAAY